MKKSVRYMPMVLLIVLLFAINGCSQGDTATVTIKIAPSQHVSTNKPSLIDRVLAFLTFTKNASAGPIPGGYDVTVIVSGPGMTDISAAVPNATGVVTLEVPVGIDRKFSAVAYNSDGVKEYSGIACTDLSPGEQATVQIDIWSLLGISTSQIYGAGPIGVELNWNYLDPTPYDPPGLIGFKIYRAPESISYTDPETRGSYIPIVEGRKEDFDSEGYRYPVTEDYGTLQYRWLYYKIAPTFQCGEGEPSYVAHYYC